MARQIISRILPGFRGGRLWRAGLVVAAVLGAGVSALVLSGTASAGNGDKQISITMDPRGQDIYRSVKVCPPDRDDDQACTYLARHGESVFYKADEWFHGQVVIKAEPYSGRTWFSKTFTICESQKGDWASLMWWDPLAACQAEGLTPLLPGVPLEVRPGVPLEPGSGTQLRQDEGVPAIPAETQPVEAPLLSELWNGDNDPVSGE
ncbi:MAG TPA: hypothetical protein VGR06_09725 [Actinophytocola sp.]|jgi:hypothetical protein|uniref:hypothetical protein n=1 Tax=Actinophytocola sp. TaxID=1872138 RepID=UPI002E0AF808|nr:hypothetical protein [Actinophytocola sp.]